MYGKEVILDLHNCDVSTFTRRSIRKYCKVLCKAIDMHRDTLVFWDDYGVPAKYKQTQPHTKGITAVQFILTSNITIHTLSDLKSVYLNIFSCKDFDEKKAAEISKDWFKGDIVTNHIIIRR